MSILKMKPEALLTLTAFTLAGLAPLAVSAAPHKRAAASEGHGAGNGGDRLELTSDDGDGDVEISVPNDMGSSGTLEVDGTPGAGQKDEVQFSFCESDSRGEPVRLGCSVEVTSIHLNTPTVLKPGTYLLKYSNTRMFVHVRRNEKTVATLKKLKVTKADHPISFAVFNDYTDPSMQDLRLKSSWSNAANEAIGRVCERNAAANQEACMGWASGDYRDSKRIVQFQADGTLLSWQFGYSGGGFVKVDRDYVTDPEAGQFVSVFPGVYGVVFTDSQNGQTQTRYGIHVN